MDEVRDGVKITTDIEATDLLEMLVRKIQLESPHKGDLRKQAQEVVEKITYLGGELKVIEVDGIDIEPYETKGIDVAVGQRVSVLVTMKCDPSKNYAIVGAMGPPLAFQN